MWLASEEEALGVFERGEDIYCVMATAIYGYPCYKDTHPAERAMGKIAVLGLGYQMGWRKFKEQCANAGVDISDEFAQQVVDAYRAKFWRIRDMWRQQEDSAIEAVRHPGLRVECGAVTWVQEGRFLFCELPSGRRLAYPDPEVRMKMTPWDELRPALTFMGVDKNFNWSRQQTYGGMLVENITQAVARDLMAYGLLQCARSGLYVPILTVHDELIAEAKRHTGNVHEFERLMASVPGWAVGCPVVAEGWTGLRYRK
jgi:DNA polymerase